MVRKTARLERELEDGGRRSGFIPSPVWHVYQRTFGRVIADRYNSESISEFCLRMCACDAVGQHRTKTDRKSLPARRLNTGHFVLLAALFILSTFPGAGGATDNAEDDRSAPLNLALERCWDDHGFLDLGNTFHNYHLEIEWRENSTVKAVGGTVIAAADDITIDMLDEKGNRLRRCHHQHTDGLRAQYACNSAARRLAAHGPGFPRLVQCAVSAWGEAESKAMQILTLAHELYSSANQESPGCNECKGPLKQLQQCARLSLVRAAGGDASFSRWLAACTNDAGTIWLRRGMHERALQMFRRALPLIQGHPIVTLNIAQVVHVCACT